jgi:SAM-dependent methyltransferase
VKRCLHCQRRFDGADWRCPSCGFAPDVIDGLPAFAVALPAAQIGFDASRFEAVANAQDRHFWFCSRTRLIAWALRRYFPQAKSLLEIGCGTGAVLAGLAGQAGLRLTGSEVHLCGLGFAAHRVPGASLLQMDARHIPYRDEFDVIGAFDVIEHIDEDELVLAEMFRACRSGGGIVLTVPQHRWLWSYRDEFAGHRRRYERAELLDKLAAAGFQQVRATSFMTLPLPLMALSRRRQRGSTGFDADSELKIGSVANRMLGFMLGLERLLVYSGVSLPIGGSLLAIARKP